MEDNTEEVTQTSNIIFYFEFVKLYQLYFFRPRSLLMKLAT